MIKLAKLVIWQPPAPIASLPYTLQNKENETPTDISLLSFFDDAVKTG